MILGKGITFTFLDGNSHQYILENNRIYYVVPSETQVSKKIALCTNIKNTIPFKIESSKEITVNFFINKEYFSNKFYITK